MARRQHCWCLVELGLTFSTCLRKSEIVSETSCPFPQISVDASIRTPLLVWLRKTVTTELRKERKKHSEYIKVALGHNESKDFSLSSVAITKYSRLGD